MKVGPDAFEHLKGRFPDMVWRVEGDQFVIEEGSLSRAGAGLIPMVARPASVEVSFGLGDLIAWVLQRLGMKPNASCACARRRAWLNERFPLEWLNRWRSRVRSHSLAHRLTHSRS